MSVEVNLEDGGQICGKLIFRNKLLDIIKIKSGFLRDQFDFF